MREASITPPGEFHSMDEPGNPLERFTSEFSDPDSSAAIQYKEGAKFLDKATAMKPEDYQKTIGANNEKGDEI